MNLRRRNGYALGWFIGCILSSQLAIGAGATVDSATKAQLKTATGYYERGVTAMDAEKYEEALAQFRLSYDTVSSPNSRLMIGRILSKTGKLAEAYQVFEQTLEQTTVLARSQKKYLKTVETASKELEDIKRQIAFVRVKHGAKMTVQGAPVELASWQTLLPVMPGTVAVEVTFTNGRQLRQSLTLKAGDTAEVAVDEPPSNPGEPTSVAATDKRQEGAAGTSDNATLDRRTVGYVVGGTGIVGLGAFVGLGLIVAGGYGDAKKDCTLGNCPEGAVDDQGGKSLMQGLGYAGLGVGILGVGIGTWLVLSGGPSTPATALHLTPQGIQIAQRF